MPEFALDLTLTAAVRVDAENLDTAVRYLRELLQGYGPSVGIALPTGGVSDVATAEIAEISLGLLRKGAPQADMALYEAGGEVINGGDPIVLDDMAEPQLCDSHGTGDGVDCHVVYDEVCGDGYAGQCPAHADAGEPRA